MSREGERRFAVLTIPIDPSRGMEKKKISLSVELKWVKFRKWVKNRGCLEESFFEEWIWTDQGGL